MKFKNIILSFVFTLVFIFILVGCGNKTTKIVSTNKPTTVTDKPTTKNPVTTITTKEVTTTIKTDKSEQLTVQYLYGSEELESSTFNKGDKITKPTDPSLEGARFLGWYIDENLETKFDFDSIPETSCILYAKWNVDITFEENGGNDINTVNKDAGDFIILPIPTDNEERQFSGWFYDEGLTERVESLLTVPNYPIKVYAKWASVEPGTAINFLPGLVANEESHYVIVDQSGGKLVTPTDDKTTWSYIYSPIETSLEGYTILHVQYNGTDGASMIVKLEGGNGVTIEEKLLFDGTTIDEYWILDVSNISTISGQRILIFVDGGTAGNEFETSVLITKLEFCKLKGTDEQTEQVIVFNTQGGSQIKSLSQVLGSPLAMPENPTKPGFVFDGWFKDAECKEAFTDTLMPEGPTTLYAKWIDAPLHNVSFVTGINQSLDSIQVKEGLTIPTSPLTNDAEGWKFDGWYKDQAFKNADLTMDNSDVTLYAKWLTLADLSNSETAINILKGWVSSDAGVYEFNESENSVVVTANTNKGKWSLFKHDISNVDGKFANALHFEVQGKEGQSILIKYNNKYEKKFILTGERQDLWMYLANELDTSINLMIFYGPNQTLTEAEQITFYKFEVLEPIDKLEHINILKGWFSNEEGKFEVVEESNSTSMTATTNKIGWEFVKIDLTQIENIDGNNLKSIVFEVQGEADHTFILKYNNRKEQKYVLDGTKQSFELEFAEPIDLSISNHLIIFIDGGKKIEEPVSITFTKLELISEYHEPVNIVYEDKQVDILKGWFDADGKGGYIVEENEDSVVVTATSLKGTWSTLKLFIDENVNNASKITIVAQGPVDQAILFKYNNSKEQKFIFDGTVQTFEMDITNLDVSKPLYFFLAPGQLIDDGNEMVVTFTKIEMIVKVAVSE